VGWEQHCRLRAGERRDAVKGAEGQAHVAQSICDSLLEQLLIVSGIAVRIASGSAITHTLLCSTITTITRVRQRPGARCDIAEASERPRD
jgi:hypothetical protein